MFPGFANTNTTAEGTGSSSQFLMLPPHWREVEDLFDGTIKYYNDITGEETDVHPYEKFLAASKKFQKAPSRPPTGFTDFATDNGSRGNSRGVNFPNNENYDNHRIEEGSEEDMNSGSAIEQEGGGSADGSKGYDYLEVNHDQPPSPSFEADPNVQQDLAATLQSSGNLNNTQGGKKYEYHCQWSERDVFGKVSLYGLTIRYLENGDTLIKFDGIDGAWTYTALKGPYGVLDMYDLFVGAKINVFGRHLTISSANAAASHWIQSETRRLYKQQEEFRKKIESIGQVPCIKKKDITTIRHITRSQKTAGSTNLRQLLKENARLGEQLASLGLTQGLY